MQCSSCKTVIQKGVMILDTNNTVPIGDGDEEIEVPVYYCKTCFIREFVNDH